MRLLIAALTAAALCGCSSTTATTTPNSGAGAGQDARPRDQAAVIEVVQDPAGTPYVFLGHVRASGSGRAFDVMERVKVEARALGADAITNVQRVAGADQVMYEADAIQWRRD